MAQFVMLQPTMTESAHHLHHSSGVQHHPPPAQQKQTQKQSHSSGSSPKPKPPHHIHLVKPNNEAVVEAQEFARYLEKSKNGVIYFSLSKVQSNTMRAEKLDAILATFRELPCDILWAYDDLTLANRLPNVKIAKWMPQSDILANRNVKLAVTDGDIYTIEEAVYHKVPMVVVPMAGDQPFHAKRVETLGIGVLIDYNTLDKWTLLTAIHHVLDNPAYRENIARVSARFLDDPQSALQRAVYWTEYVLHHDGAHHLRYAGAMMPAYQYFLVDVVVVTVTVFAVTVLAVVYAMRTVYGVLWRSRMTSMPMWFGSRRQRRMVLVGVLRVWCLLKMSVHRKRIELV